MVIENTGDNELRFRNPGSLLVVVIGFIFWGVGFLDILGHTSAQPDVLGLYSLPFFIFLILYASTVVFWIALFVSPKFLIRVIGSIRAIQSRTWLALLTLASIAVALWIVLEWNRWSRVPGLQFACFSLLILAGAVILFSGWRSSQGQHWRRIIASPLAVLLIIEVIIQGLTLFGMLPGTQKIGGDFVPYERVYTNQEGTRNGFANRYGWYFPDFEIDDDKRRVLILGGSHVQGLAVPPKEQVSALLSERLSSVPRADGIQTEVIAIGLPGFGPGPYLDEEFLSELFGMLNLDEIVVLFHLGNDFQRTQEPADPLLYMVDESGDVAVDPRSIRLRHDLTHYFLRGFLSLQPVETIRSNYMTPKVFRGLSQGWLNEISAMEATTEDVHFPRQRGSVAAVYMLTEPGHAGIKATDVEVIPDGNNFLFVNGENEDVSGSMAVAHELLSTAHNVASENDVGFHVVTVPIFPETFFEQNDGNDWTPDFGSYDLLRPERMLLDVAHTDDIPILPMGQFMFEDKVTADEIEQFYLKDNQNFAPAGHQYFADAIYTCIFSESTSALCNN